MKFGLRYANLGRYTEPGPAVEIAQAAEEAGFESIWTIEHVIVPDRYESVYPYAASGKMTSDNSMPIPDPLVWLTYVAAVTERIKLATGILIVPQRNPVVLAKTLASIDHLSGGRMLFGIGVGWLEEEFNALGIPFADRGQRTDDHIAALRALWTQPEASHKSEYSSFTGAISRPQPTQGTVPIVVGGHSKAAARRAGRLGDGFFPGKGSHEELAELIDVMRETATEHGRDPDAIAITAGGNGALGSGALDEVKALADLGVSRVIVPPLSFDPRSQPEAFAKYGEDVISRC